LTGRQETVRISQKEFIGQLTITHDKELLEIIRRAGRGVLHVNASRLFAQQRQHVAIERTRVAKSHRADLRKREFGSIEERAAAITARAEAGRHVFHTVGQQENCLA
jgi:hypothetical protein